MPPASSLVIGHLTSVIPRRRRRGGFALLITITLLAFLVLLLVSLAALTRVETQVASNNQHIAQARQNALMALNIAIGQLQKYTGPDQRTTARADLQHAPDVPNARWIGVYGGGVAAGYNQTPSQLATALTTSDAADARGSSAKLLTWLVSGNEKVPFDPETAVGASGEIIQAPATTSIPFRPDQAVNLTVANANALAAQLTITTAAGAQPTRLLVGPASVASAVADNGVPIDYVAAPLVDIQVQASTIPGFDASAPDQTVGRYAWWVGDEGMKARLNLPAPATLAEKTTAFASAPRAAVELVNTNVTELPVPALNAVRLGTASGVEKVIAFHQLPMASPAHASELSDAARYRLHDLTARSFSVLADAAVGGLKLDLSSALAAGATVTADTDFLFPAESGAGNDYGVPTWAQLRSFAQPVAVSGTGAATPRLPTAAGQTGISPVLTYFALGFQYAKDPAGDSLRLALFPVVILWNPYTVPLEAADYEVGFVKRNASRAKFRLQVETAPDTWEDRETRDLNRDLAVVGGTAHAYVRFCVSTKEIPPGRSLIFTLGGSESGKLYNGENLLTNPATPLDLVGGYAYLPGPAIAPGESTVRYRVMGAPGSDTAGLTGGEMDVYLGVPRQSSPVGYDPTGKSWYQTIQRVGSTGSNPPFQGPALLSDATFSIVTEPVFSIRVWDIFSGLSSINKSAGLKVRWIAQANPRAHLVTRLPGDTNSNLTYGGVVGKGGVSDWQHFLPSASGTRASAGPSLDCEPDPVDVTLFELPRSGQPLLSLGQLQHAPLSLVSGYPAYAFGNSLADYRIDPDRLHLKPEIKSPDNTLATKLLLTHYDVSWLLNHALWDRAFFSGVPATGATPANPRHVRLDDYVGTELHDPERAAAHLLVAGGFNINSTSEQAWRAVLGGLNRLAYDPVNPADPDAASLDGAPLARFARPTADDNLATPWQGYRLLTENQVARLARDVVSEIRARGPFVSLADFVNRRLVDNPDTAVDERLKGALQAALDATTTTTTAGGESIQAVNDATTSPFRDVDGLADKEPNIRYFLFDHFRGGPAAVAPYGSRSAFAPKFLTQADILSAVGAGLAARSDTFVIRTYGEAVNPVLDATDGAYVTGRAWCEAVVQRLPEYVKPDSAPDGDRAYAAPTHPANQHFGRRFKIVSFRWLSSSDI